MQSSLTRLLVASLSAGSLFAAAGVLPLTMTPKASAQSQVASNIPPQQKLMAKRAAELDAYRLMAERILGLKLSSGTSVRDFVTESDEIRTSVEGFIRGVRIVETRYYADGTAEVDAEVTLRQVVEHLKKVRDEVYKDGRWTKEDLEQITRQTRDSVLRVTGSGAARAESGIQDPATAEIIPAPEGATRTRPIDIPEIYRQYPPNKRLMAKRAAELDGYRKLLERIGGLSLRSGTRVRDFITESDEIRTAVEGSLRGARIENVRYAPDGVVEVQMSVTLEQVIETVKKVRDEVYKDGRWTKQDFEDIKRSTKRKVITVMGTGALDTGGQPVEGFDQGDPETIIIGE
ncbi:MAG: LPP20 family lipoprotein [Planctomycetota bacterium]|nr:LPP20 family lipoprotein [Planctomycetota bacterium]